MAGQRADKKKNELDLDAIVEELDPDNVDKAVGDRHSDAREDYKLPKNERKAKDYQSFKDAVIKYVKHHKKAVNGHSPSDHEAFSDAYQLVDSAFRRQGEDTGQGWVRAYQELARKGKMREVLDAIAKVAETRERQQYIQHVFHKVDPFDRDVHLSFAERYLEKYKTILPKDYQTMTAEQLAGDWQGLINTHQEFVGQLKRQLGKYKPKLEDGEKAAAHN